MKTANTKAKAEEKEISRNIRDIKDARYLNASEMQSRTGAVSGWAFAIASFYKFHHHKINQGN